MLITFEQLQEKYSVRRGSLEKDLAKTKAQGTRNLLTTAVANADVCLKVLVSIPPEVEAWSAKLKALTESVVDSQQTVIEVAQKSQAETESIQDAETKQQDLASGASDNAKASKSFKLQEEVVGNLLALPPLIVDHFISTLFQIYDSSSGRPKTEIMLALLDYLVGATPVLGPIVSGIEAIRKMLHAGESTVKSADEYFVEFERFNLASFHWAVTAHFVFHNMAAADDVHKITLDQAVQQIEAWRV